MNIIQRENIHIFSIYRVLLYFPINKNQCLLFSSCCMLDRKTIKTQNYS